MKNILIIMFSVLLFGCATAPEVQGPILDVVHVPIKPANIAIIEKNLFFRLILQKVHDSSPFIAIPHPKRPKEVKSYWQSDGIIYRGGTNINYYFKFYLDENNQLIRETLSRSWHGRKEKLRDCLLCSDNGFTKYVDGLVIRAAEAYNVAIESYIANKKRKLRLETQLKDMLRHTKVNVTAPIALPNNITDSIINGVHFELVLARYQYSIQEGLKLSDPFVKVVSHLPLDIKPLRNINYNISTDRFEIDDKPVVDVSIESAFFDMLPESLQVKNNDISISLENGMLKIFNNTNNFIDVESFTIYWGDKVSTLESISLSIPPQSMSSKNITYQFELYRSPQNRDSQDSPRYKKLEDIHGVFPFGVALSYFNIDTNKRNTLLERSIYSRKGFKSVH